MPDSLTISKVLSFENSTYKATNNIWDISLKGVIGRGRIKKDLYDIGKEQWLELIELVEQVRFFDNENAFYIFRC